MTFEEFLADQRVDPEHVLAVFDKPLARIDDEDIIVLVKPRASRIGSERDLLRAVEQTLLAPELPHSVEREAKALWEGYLAFAYLTEESGG